VIDWATVFEEAHPKGCATEAEVAALVAGLGQPLSPAEVARVNAAQRNPYPVIDALHTTWQPFDPSAWVMPAGRPVPPSYLSFVRYSDGG
jgi:hypothetical protein